VRSRSGGVSDFLATFVQEDRERAAEIDRQVEGRRRHIEREDIDPPRGRVRRRRFEFIVSVMIRFFGFEQMSVDERCSVAVVIPIMEMKKRASDQSEKHRADSQINAKPLHVLKFCCTPEALSTSAGNLAADFAD
jgi:hypothetical protein